MDRFDCSTAIADSWKQQMLLNIVKLRYMDLPVFVDVSSVVSGYSMQTGANINGTLSSQNAVQGNFGSLGGQGHLYRPPHHHLCALDRGRSSSAAYHAD